LVQQYMLPGVRQKSCLPKIVKRILHTIYGGYRQVKDNKKLNISWMTRINNLYSTQIGVF